MNQDQIRALTMLHNVQAYMNHAVEKTPLLTNTGAARRRLEQVVAQLREQMADKAAATQLLREAAHHQQSRRAKLLYRYVAPLSRVANAELTEPEQQLDLESFRMPRKNIGVERLADTAREMAQAAVAHAGDFIAAGLPIDFIQRLERATERMLETISIRARAGVRRNHATATIRSLLADARGLVKVLDTWVSSAFRANPGALAAWNAAKRLPSSRVRKPALT